MASHRSVSVSGRWRDLLWWIPLPLLRQLLVLALALAGVLFIGMLTLELQQRGSLIQLMAVCALALGVLVVLRPGIGLAALVACAIAVRVSLGTGSQSPVVASLLCACLLIAGWFVHRALNRQQLNLLPGSVAIPAVLVMATTIFSMLWGRLSLDPRITYEASFLRVQVAAAAIIIVSVGLLFVCGELFCDRRARTAVVAAIVAAGFVALAFKAVGATAPALNTAGLFGLWFVALCWANALANERLHPVTRWLLGSGAVGWLLAATLAQGWWVSGWFPGMVALLLITLIARPLAGLALTLTAAVLVSGYFSLLHDFVVVRQQEEGSLDGDFGRLELWQRNIDLLGDHLLLGTGPGGYAMYYMTFIPDRAMSTHNNYFDILAQIGVPGLLSFVALLAALWALARRMTLQSGHSADRAVALAVAGGVPAVAASLFLGDWLLPFVYNQTIAGFDHSVYSWLMFAMACGLYAEQRRRAGDDG